MLGLVCQTPSARSTGAKKPQDVRNISERLVIQTFVSALIIRACYHKVTLKLKQDDVHAKQGKKVCTNNCIQELSMLWLAFIASLCCWQNQNCLQNNNSSNLYSTASAWAEGNKKYLSSLTYRIVYSQSWSFTLLWIMNWGFL